MKKLLLFIAIITIGYACKKKDVEPSVQKITQTTSDRCQDSGICGEGYYNVMPVVNVNTDTIINQSNTTNLGHCKLVFIRYQHRPNALPTDMDTLLYRFVPLDFGTNVLSTDSLYTNVHMSYGREYINTSGLKTKSGKTIILNFDHH